MDAVKELSLTSRVRKPPGHGGDALPWLVELPWMAERISESAAGGGQRPGFRRPDAPLASSRSRPAGSGGLPRPRTSFRLSMRLGRPPCLPRNRSVRPLVGGHGGPPLPPAGAGHLGPRRLLPCRTVRRGRILRNCGAVARHSRLAVPSFPNLSPRVSGSRSADAERLHDILGCAFGVCGISAGILRAPLPRWPSRRQGRPHQVAPSRESRQDLYFAVGYQRVHLGQNLAAPDVVQQGLLLRQGPRFHCCGERRACLFHRGEMGRQIRMRQLAASGQELSGDDRGLGSAQLHRLGGGNRAEQRDVGLCGAALARGEIRRARKRSPNPTGKSPCFRARVRCMMCLETARLRGRNPP